MTPRLARFFKEHHPPAYEAEFRAVYQAPGVRLLAVCFSLAIAVFALFYWLDRMSLGWGLLGGVQTFRLAVILCMGSVVAFALLRPQAALRHYTSMAVVSMVLGLQAAAFVAYLARRDMAPAELYWAMTSSMETGIVLVFGFSRLTSMATLMVALSGTAAALAYLLHTFVASDPAHTQYLGRMLGHLVLATIACYVLRATIEARERRLFLTGKELLDKATYINQLEVARLAAEQSDQAKAKFLATMSHEVRTPMAAVIQTLEVIRDKLVPSDQFLVARAQASAQSLLRVLTAILDYTKLSAGAASLYLTPVDLRRVVETVNDLFAGPASAREVRLRTSLDLDDGADVVFADEVKLIEILNNLTSNALKFTDHGGVDVSLSARRVPSNPTRVRVSITVTDTGSGISAQDMPDLFKPFRQTRGGRERSSGTGLGLSIVHQLAELMYGTVEAESTPGKGSTFRVRFEAEIAAPRALIPSIEPASASAPIPEPHSKPVAHLDLRVLLAEDHEINAELAKLFLEGFGCSVVHTANGPATVKAFKEQRFDLVLLDCRMPGLDGFATTSAIRQDEADRGMSRTPIVAVTANAMVGDKDFCLGQGMDDFLAKPFTRQQLLEMLMRWGRPTPA